MRIRAYLRKSTEQHQIHSLETQETRITEYCKFNYPNVEIVFYRDIMSGTKDNRPEFIRVMNESENGDLVVIYNLSRLSRSVKTCLEIFEELEKRNVKIISISEKIDTSHPMGKFQTTLMASLAELEVGILKGRISDALARLIQDKKLKRKPKLGFKSQGKGKEIVEDEEEQKVINLIKKMYVEENKHPSLIAKELNSQNIKFRKAKKIYTNIVKQILVSSGVYEE